MSRRNLPRASKTKALRTLFDVVNDLENGGGGDVFIQPPVNYADPNVSDEDDAVEGEPVTIDNLPGRQLNAPAELGASSDEDDEEIPAKKPSKECPEWKKNGSLACSFPEWQPALSPTHIDKPSTPVELFEYFFDEVIIANIVAFTNQYAQQHNRNLNVSTMEMKCFLGVLLLSGYVPLPRMKLYWENQVDVKNSLVPGAMRRDRFWAIKQNLHLCDNFNLDPNDKYTKLRPLLTAMP